MRFGAPLSSAASGLVWRQFRAPYLLPFSPYPDPIKFAPASEGTGRTEYSTPIREGGRKLVFFFYYYFTVEFFFLFFSNFETSSLFGLHAYLAFISRVSQREGSSPAEAPVWQAGRQAGRKVYRGERENVRAITSVANSQKKRGRKNKTNDI